MTKETKPPTILIVGGGLVGACLAYRLSKSGAAVTVLEGVAPAAGASGRSWAWINARAADNLDYYALRQASIHAYHDLDQELAGKLPIDWTGALITDPRLMKASPGTNSEDIANSENVDSLDRNQMTQIEPLFAPPAERGILSREDAVLDAALATKVLLDEAADYGAQIVLGARVTGLLYEETREDACVSGVFAEFGRYEAETTILAAGTNTPYLLQSAGIEIPSANKPGLLILTKPVAHKLNHAIWTDDIHIKQMRDGALMIGQAAHAPNALEKPDDLTRSMLSKAETLLPTLAPLEISRTTLATRPIPGDGFPIIGPVQTRPGLYVTMMHSGVTLAAIAGRLASQEILTGETSPLLAPYRPERFAGTTEI